MVSLCQFDVLRYHGSTYQGLTFSGVVDWLKRRREIIDKLSSEAGTDSNVISFMTMLCPLSGGIPCTVFFYTYLAGGLEHDFYFSHHIGNI